MLKGKMQILYILITLLGVGIGTTLCYLAQSRILCVDVVERLVKHKTVIVYVLRRIGGFEMTELVKSYINQFQIADIFGENDCFGAYRVVYDMVVLYILHCIDELVSQLVDYSGCHFAFVDELAQ